MKYCTKINLGAQLSLKSSPEAGGELWTQSDKWILVPHEDELPIIIAYHCRKTELVGNELILLADQ